MDWIRDLCLISIGILITILIPPATKLLYSQELYEDSDSILLNLRETSRWMNMGYWKDTNDFVQANRSLARKLSDSVGELKAPRVLDVGYGSGNSIEFWEEEMKPAKIVGVTSLKSQFQNSLNIKRQLEIEREDLEVELIQGDGANLEALNLPLSSFDVVFSLDSAYHFNTRYAFLTSANKLLKENGQLAMTDLILADNLSFFNQLCLRSIFFLARVPVRNMIELKEYQSCLSSTGFDQVEVEDISDQVFLPFVSFLERREASQLRGVFNNKKWNGLMMYGKIVKWWCRNQKLRFILVHARKSKSKDI